MSSETHSHRPMPLGIVMLGMLLPTLVTWVYFVLLSDHSPGWQQFAFTSGKLAQLALPIVALVLWPMRSTFTNKQIDAPEILVRSRFTPSKILVGIASGIAISGMILVIYWWVLLPIGVMNGVREQAVAKLSEMGLQSVWTLLAMAVFYSLLHSGFEEFYWRGFVSRGWTDHVSQVWAVGLSSIGFMLHHILVIARYFEWTSPWTYVCSAGVAVGGIVWAILYQRTGTLVPSWISHGFVDAALFAIAIHLIYAT